MSLYGALFSGVSGLAAQSSAMGAISDNIANVNTTGYKGSKVNFNTLVTKQVSLTNYSPGGVQSKPRASIDVQGLLQATNSSTDMAMSGQGFFVVNEAANPGNGDMFAYTRAGSFKVDKEGYLQNVSGWYMQGWPLMAWDNSLQASTVTVGNSTYMKGYKDSVGEQVYINDNIVSSTQLRPLNLNEVGGTASQTRNLRMGANLPNGDVVGKSHKQDVTLYDSLGGDANVQFNWTKRAQNQWDLKATPPVGARSMQLRQTTAGSVYSSSGRLDFTDIPQSGGALTMTLGPLATDKWTFNLSAGTDGGASRTMYTDPTSASSLGSFITNLAQDINKAYKIELESVTGVPPNLPYTAADTISFTSNGTTTAVDLNGAATVDDIVTKINAQSSTTYVKAFNNNGVLSLYSDDARSIAITAAGAGNDMVGFNGTTINGTGKTYCEALGGSNALVFHQDSAVAADLTVAGLDSIQLANGNSATLQGMDPSTTSSTDQFTLDQLDIATPAITFNGDGTPATINVASMEIDWANGSTDMTGSADEIGLFLGNTNIRDGMTQLNGDYQLAYWNQNGAKFGNFAGVSIGSDGIVTALFDNGVTRPVFQIPVSTFVNPNGMQSLTGNVFISTDNSGEPTLRQAGSAGAGQVNAAALEASTVDIGEEFTTMIVTQRAYSAAAKIITTADQMLDELVQIKR